MTKGSNSKALSKPRGIPEAEMAGSAVSRARDSDRSSDTGPTEPSTSTNRPPLTSNAKFSELVASPLPFRRTIRRAELRKIVPLSDTTIYELERRGEFPKRFYITSRCVVWDLEEIESWLNARRSASETGESRRAAWPDVKQRKTRPVKSRPEP